MTSNKLTLADRCYTLRNTTEYKLDQSSYMLLMLDGRGFSKFCKRFKKPYSDEFIDIMNKVAIELCKTIQNAKFGYVQSDEISIFITPSKEHSQAWFDARFNKICSVAASIASSVFTREYIKICTDLNNIPTISFDCKAWNVNNINDVYAWFLFRNIDCIRNSKQMMSQTYLSQKILVGNDSDKQIALVKDKTGLDWHEYPEKYKFGRVVYKEKRKMFSAEHNAEFERNIWLTEHDLKLLPFNADGARDNFISLFKNL